MLAALFLPVIPSGPVISTIMINLSVLMLRQVYFDSEMSLRVTV